MGRKSQLPPSRTLPRKKQDNGPAAFFKHRKQQQQQAAALVAHSTATNHAADTKGKQRDQQLEQIALDLSAPTSTAHDDTAETANTANAPAFSPYDHLSQGNFHGGTRDSSVRAYGRHLRSLIEQSDVLIQVLDARDPLGSRSTSTEALLLAHPGKKLLFVLTKIDLVPKAALQAWLTHLRQSHPTLAFKSTSTLSSSGRAQRKLHTFTNSNNASDGSGSTSTLEASSAATLLQLLKNYARSQPKGMSLTVGIFGPPNVGKSSLINSLVRSRACSVAPRPGETKALQTVLLDRKVRLIDSPGVAMPASAAGTSASGSATAHTQEVLRGTVKLELVEDPITPVATILQRADPVKVTRLYGLPALDLAGEGDDDGDDEGREEMETTDQQDGAFPSAPAALTPALPTSLAAAGKSSKADFDTMRAEENSDDDDDDDDDDDAFDDARSDEEDFHRPTFQDDDDDDDEPVAADTTPTQRPSARLPQPRQPLAIGYDPSDPMDFLLRLALTKGKMLRGGRPDVDGAARTVINDWNTGKIAWFVRPPGAGGSANAHGKSTSAGTEKDEEMRGEAEGGEEAPQQQANTTVLTAFSDEFDLAGLFAQADAQLFGGGGGGGGSGAEKSAAATSATTAASGPPAPAKNTQVLQASDVSASSLGKRGRGGGDGAGADSDSDEERFETADEDEDDDGDESDSNSDSDSDDERIRTRRIVGVPGPSADASLATPAQEDAMIVDEKKAKPPAKHARGARPAQDDELSSFLGPQKQNGLQSASTGGNKRGQKKKGKHGKRSAGDDVPAYLEKQSRKAATPGNIKKRQVSQAQAQAQGALAAGIAGGAPWDGAPARKAGEERRKKRKMERREVARGGVEPGVWRGLGEVTLE